MEQKEEVSVDTERLFRDGSGCALTEKSSRGTEKAPRRTENILDKNEKSEKTTTPEKSFSELFQPPVVKCGWSMPE